MGYVRGVLLAFCGALTWFFRAAETQTNGSCFGASHYIPSAAIALGIVVTLDLALEGSFWLRRDGSTAASQQFKDVVAVAAATAVLLAIGLLIGGFFAAAISCSA